MGREGREVEILKGAGDNGGNVLDGGEIVRSDVTGEAIGSVRGVVSKLEREKSARERVEPLWID